MMRAALAVTALLVAAAFAGHYLRRALDRRSHAEALRYRPWTGPEQDAALDVVRERGQR